MTSRSYKANKKKDVGNIFCFLILFFLFSTNLFAQQTNNLEVIWVKTSPDSVIAFGRCIVSGDVNGDGCSDIIVVGDSIIRQQGGVISAYRGKCWIFYGGLNFDTIPDVQLLNTQEELFVSLYASDINGDGFDDVIIGANHNRPTSQVLIFLGGNPMDSICDFILRGNSGSGLGCSIGSGDVNGDGYRDLIVGAAGEYIPPIGEMAGRVYIYWGGPNFDTIPDVILNGGHHSNAEAFGTTVSGSGDVNCDGFDDIIVGAMNFRWNRGRIYIYYGGNPMDTNYDVAMMGQEGGESIGEFGVGFLINENTFDHAIFSSPLWGPSSPQGYNPGKVYILLGGNQMDSIPDIWMIGRTAESGLGHTVYSAGRCNNDLYDEVIAGAPIEYNHKGTAYLWLGSTLLDTIPDAWLRGLQYDDGIGWAVATAGDVDGDGRDEIMVSNYASNYSPKRVWVCKYTGAGTEERLTHYAKRLTLEVRPSVAKTFTVISVSCPFALKEIRIYDITGKLVKMLDVRCKMLAQEEKIRWDLRDDKQKRVANGIYFVELTADEVDSRQNTGYRKTNEIKNGKIREIKKIVITK